MPHILGQRILLREYRLSDLSEMRKWVNDPRVTRGLSDIFLFPHSQEATEEFLRDVLEGRSDTREFVVASRPSEAYLGQIGLKVLDWKNRFAEISLVFPREHQGQGYGTEAIGLLQRFAVSHGATYAVHSRFLQDFDDGVDVGHVSDYVGNQHIFSYFHIFLLGGIPQ